MKINNEFECNCKVARAASRANLEGVDNWIKASWRGVGTKKKSLRGITNELNTRVLKGILKQRDTQFLPSQAGFLRKVIEADDQATDLDISRVERGELLAELEAEGLSAESVNTELFISYQTLHTHLKEHLSVETPTQTQSREETVESHRDTLRRLNSRTEAIAGGFVEKDVNTESIDIDRFNITDTTVIRCEKCGYNKRVTQFLGNGGCDCSDVSLESTQEGSTSATDEAGAVEDGSDTDTDTDSDLHLAETQERIEEYIDPS